RRSHRDEEPRALSDRHALPVERGLSFLHVRRAHDRRGSNLAGAVVRRALAFVVLMAVAIAGIAFVACGPSASDVPVLRPDGGGCLPGYGCSDGGLSLDSGPITIPNEPLEDWDAAADGSLTGIFAVEATVTAQAGVTVTSKQLYRLRIAQSGTHIH